MAIKFNLVEKPQLGVARGGVKNGIKRKNRWRS